MIRRLFFILLQRLYLLKSRTLPSQGRIYMFHNVNDDGDTYSITKEHFEEWIGSLLKDRKIVDIDTLVREKDPKNVVITFDDVYESVYRNAFPILKEKGIPYYLFLCNEYLDHEKYVTSDMVREMLSDSKAIVGSHNYRHELSRFKETEQMKEELERSKDELEKELSVKIDTFAFPYGSMYACSKENIETARKRFRYVFMTYAVPYHESCGNIIPRINMNDSTFRKEMK